MHQLNVLKAFVEMMTYLTLFSAFSFLFFGWACFFTPQMKSEFKRYGLVPFRRIVAGLQVIGGGGLLVGICYLPLIQLIAAGGLSLLMLLGLLVRLRIKDSLLQAAPSIFYALLNTYIFSTLLDLF